MSNTTGQIGGVEGTFRGGVLVEGGATVTFPAKAEPTPTRATQEEQKEVVLDSDTLANVQRGVFKQSEFFGDQSMTAAHKLFQIGTAAAALYQGFASSSRVDPPQQRTEGSDFTLTEAELYEIDKRATSIAQYGNISVETASDFLIILCSVSRYEDMLKIADALQIDELADPTILRQPYSILAIPRLEKIAYMASAVEALTKMFRRYTKLRDNSDISGKDDVSSVMSNLSSLLGGFGTAAATIESLLQSPDATKAVGQLMGELISGKIIPMSVIAKNPNIASPSFIGKAMFGESPTALSNIDFDSIFAKKIGVFPKPSNGSGTTAFGLQNFGSMAGNMSVNSFINKALTGGASAAVGSFKEQLISTALQKVSALTGATGLETINLKSADTAIPLLNALSAVTSGTDKSPFSIDTFQKSWILANSVSNTMQQNQQGFMDSIRLFA